MIQRCLLASLFVLSSMTAQGWTTHRPVGSDFGVSMAAAGDVNADGVDDLVVGAIEGLNGEGFIEVLSGQDGTVLLKVDGAALGDAFGFDVDGAGDLNGDGHADVIVGAPRSDVAATDAGSALVISGADGSVLFTRHGAATDDRFGSRVTGLGDIDGDGHDDVAVAADREDHPNGDQRAGAIRVFSGADGSLIQRWRGGWAFASFGENMDGAGDVDADGYPDIVFTFDASPNGSFVLVASPRTGATIHQFAYPSNSRLTVAGAGDVDADGFDDIIIGDPLNSWSFNQWGSAAVYSGRTGAQLHFVNIGQRPWRSEFGWSVDGCGDVDGDGHDDFMAGAPSDYGPGLPLDDTGSVSVFSGATGAVLLERIGGAVTKFGTVVVGDLDIDGDGDPDIAVAEGNAPRTVHAIDMQRNARRGFERTRGSSCPGAGGRLPRIGVIGDAIIDETIEVTLRGAVQSGTALLYIGTATAVPLDLIGVPCTLHTAPFVGLSFATDGAGFARAPIALPNNPGLAGFTADLQWISIDPGAPHALPVAPSNALTLTIDP